MILASSWRGLFCSAVDDRADVVERHDGLEEFHPAERGDVRGLGADFDGCIRSDCVGDFGECLAFGVSRSFSAEGHSEWQRPFLRERAGAV